jgi:hypothetical protein
MKLHYRTDLLRTLADDNGNLIGLWKKMMVLDAIYSVSWVWSSVNLVMLVQSWRKLLPDVEGDDLHGFPNEETSKFEILDVCAMRSFENIEEEILKNGYRAMHVKWVSST